MDKLNGYQRDLFGAAVSSPSLRRDYEPARAAHFEVERICLAKGSITTPERKRFVERKLKPLIGNRVLYPDGTVNSFVQRYLRERVLKLFDTKPRKPAKSPRVAGRVADVQWPDAPNVISASNCKFDGIIGCEKMHVSPERWWEYAERDLETARVLLRAQRWDATSLFAQQAVEKAFKAMLVRKGEESPPRIHDLVVLARRAGAPATLERDLTELSRVYVVTRYPDVVLEREPAYGIDQAMAEHHLQVAEGALAWVRQEWSTES